VIKYIKYLRYLIRHKYYVGIECFKRGLIYQGIFHDFDKFFPDEFFPYTNHFFGKNRNIKEGRNSTGYYKPTDTGDKDFDFAWLLHQKRNKHHWQWWTLPEDIEGLKILEIPLKYKLEMLCDWIGAGKAQGYFPNKNDPLSETKKWYIVNGNKLQFAPDTRQWFDRLLLDNKTTIS